MKVFDAHFCLISHDMRFILAVKGRRAILYGTISMDKKICIFRMSENICAASFSQDDRFIALLDPRGPIMICCISDLESPTFRILRKHRKHSKEWLSAGDQRWMESDMREIFFLPDNKHVIIGINTRSPFKQGFALLNIDTEEERLIYDSNCLIRSFQYDPVRNAALLVESEIVSENVPPSRIGILDFNQLLSENIISMKLFFEREKIAPCKNGESICSVCYMPDGESILLSTELFLEKFERKNDEYVLAVQKRDKLTPHYSSSEGVMLLKGYEYFLRTAGYEGINLFSLRNMEMTKSYDIVLRDRNGIFFSSDNKFMFFPLMPGKDGVGKYCTVMLDTEKFLRGEYDDQLRRRNLLPTIY